jgi:tRNA-specific 2-thiouridylase
MTEQHPLKIAVGMSGGIDSSAAAAILVEQGHEVIGFTARMWEGASKEDIQRARQVSSFLGIRHVVVDATDYFRRMVLEPFLSEYYSGRTPSPCILCNQHVKFGHLLLYARKLGCTHMATGHYVRTEQREDGWHLYQARDPIKDQSYFLHRLSQEQLGSAIFPLGDRLKEEIRQYVAARGLPVVFCGESQDLCFLPEGNYPAFLEKHYPEVKKAGRIVDTEGKILGEHAGFYRFTIGQREGLGVAAASRLYVRELRPERNEVVLGRREELMSSGCRIEDVHWVGLEPEPNRTDCCIRLRYRHAGADSFVEKLESGAVRATFKEKQFAVTPGQAAVFYQGAEVLGGGWISEAYYD